RCKPPSKNAEPEGRGLTGHSDREYSRRSGWFSCHMHGRIRCSLSCKQDCIPTPWSTVKRKNPQIRCHSTGIPMQPTLKSALHSDRLLRALGLGQLCPPKLIELVALLGGYDAVWLDQEHVGLTLPQIEDSCRAARAAGIDVFVRLNATDYATVMRV